MTASHGSDMKTHEKKKKKKLTVVSFQTCTASFLLWNTKDAEWHSAIKQVDLKRHESE